MPNKPNTKIGVMFKLIIVLAIILSFAMASSLGEFLMSKGPISSVVHAISLFVPAVNNISSKTDYVSSAEIAIALQWCFFPIYFYCICFIQPPWKEFRFKDGITDGVRKKTIACLLVGVLFACLYFLGDIGVFNFSIFRGTIFNPTDDLIVMRLPFTGRVGLALAAFLLPFFEALIYWSLACFIGAIFLKLSADHRTTGGGTPHR